jgi:integrase
MGMIYKRGSIYWVKYYRNGRAFRESTRSEKESDAKRLLREREGDIARGLPITPKVGRAPIDELFQDVVNDYRMNDQKSSSGLRFRIKHLLPFFSGRRAADITTADIRRYIVARQAGASAGEIEAELVSVQQNYTAKVESIQAACFSKRETRKLLGLAKREWKCAKSEAKRKARASNATINRELSVLRRAFTLAVESGKLLAKPHVPELSENNVRTGFFEPEQFNAVLRHLPEHVKPVARFAYITGWRANSEILPLQWRQVDFCGGTVRLDPGSTKNREGRVFPMTVELRALLVEQKAKTEALQRGKGILNPWVFTYEGRRFKSFKRSWETARKAAGLPGRLAHDFRRTAVRNLVRAGIPERVAMDMTGHKTRSVFERYNIVSQGDLFDAARRLDSFTVENADSAKARGA